MSLQPRFTTPRVHREATQRRSHPMRKIYFSCLALAIAAGCAPRDTVKTEDAPAQAEASELLDTVEVAGARLERRERDLMAQTLAAEPASAAIANVAAPPPATLAVTAPANTERYAEINDSGIVRTAEQPVSTFSIDVDTGSYSNVRRFLAQGQLPPKDAVRVEEMINYFDFGYPGPANRREPFAVSTELAPAPWNQKRLLLQVGIQGYDVAASEVPASNLVFLIDTSGSMDAPDKLPLLKDSFRQLVPQLRAQDRVSIVVYAGSAGLVLPPTPGNQHDAILAALNQLQAGGSTNGGEGIDLAYAMAKQAFVPGGVNRIVLATDGDFNVGIYDPRALETKVEQGREAGIALTTLGFGQDNYNEALAERLADVGDGNHAYIDSLLEGRKVLVQEMTATLLTIASDVKIQMEFNPALVAEYRLIGYENRRLAREDFNNDQVDAGEIGAGHDVTALYEISLVGSGGEASDPLRYGAAAGGGARGGELAHLKLRYKLPGSDRSVLMQRPVTRDQRQPHPSENLRFAAAVAAYADLLRGGEHVNGYGWPQVETLARGARGEDTWGYRAEFLKLAAQARSLSAASPPTVLVSQE
ncbi:MAG: VWA domain-containing protein [Arenimonas sp.]|nr:VWA domain-containing protein [Arenimonas sp.]